MKNVLPSKQRINLDLKFLTKWQKNAFDNILKHRNSILIVHRRAWKSVLAIVYLIYKALHTPNKDLWYISPFAHQTKAIAWEYLKQFSLAVPGVYINNSQLIVRFKNWSSIRLFGWDNPDSLRGLDLSTIVIDEYSDINPELYNRIIFPQINFHWEHWQTIILWTPKGKDHFYEKFIFAQKDKGWYTLKLDVTQSWTLSKKLIKEAKDTIDDVQFKEEYMCSFDCAIKGSIYKDEIEALLIKKEERIKWWLYNELLPVSVHYDLWLNDATAVVFTQYDWCKVNWIDYAEYEQKGFAFWVALLKEKGYKYDAFYLPFDAEVKEYWTWTTRAETFKKLTSWMWKTLVLKRQSLLDWINAVRQMFEVLYVDVTLLPQLDRLSMYEAEWDNKKQLFKKLNKSQKKYSHLADALRYCASTHINKTKIVRTPKPFTVDYNNII